MEYLRIFDEPFNKRKNRIVGGFRLTKKRTTVNFSKHKIDLMVYLISLVYGVPEPLLRDKRKSSDYATLSSKYVDGANGMFYFFLKDKCGYSIEAICRMFHASNTYVSTCMNDVSNSTDKITKERFTYLSEKINTIEF